MTAFRARRPGQRIFVPSFAHRRGHPVLVEAALAPAFLALGEGASARDVIGAHPDQLVHVEAADDRVLLDMDTPDDYRRCLARFRAG
jgi:molybdenum cofactor cytidylyltransferase